MQREHKMVRLLLIILVIMIALPAEARQEDLFANGPIGYERPRVAGDYYRSSDMFNNSSFVMQKNRDVFDRAETFNAGYPDLFVPQPSKIPDDPLYNWPRRRAF